MNMEQRLSEYFSSAGRKIPTQARPLRKIRSAAARRLVRARFFRIVGTLIVVIVGAALTVGVLILVGL